MKQRIRTIAFICILLSGVTATKAQSAGDIDTLSQWRVDMSFVLQEPTFQYYKYFISGTELIDSIEYYKTLRSGYQQEYWSGEVTYFNNEPSGVFREEDNKWYTHNGEQDVLLFDFSLEVGDTVISAMNRENEVIIVDSVNLIQVDGEDKRQIHFTGEMTGGSSFIIEDIGASTGILLEPLISYFETSSIMHCYAIDFIPLWINNEYGYCNLTVSVEENIEVGQMKVYPNPFTTYTTIEYEIYSKCNIQYSIYNLIGEQVFYLEEKNVPPGLHKVKWSPTHMPAGMYFGVLRTDEGVSVVKMIKQ